MTTLPARGRIPAPPPPPARPPAPRVRTGSAKSRARLLAGVVMGCATIALVLGVVLAERFRLRPDVTTMNEQSLAPRTERTLDALETPHRLVIAADIATIDRRAWQGVTDVLDAMQRHQPLFSWTPIDTNSTRGLGAYNQLVGELVERDRSVLAEQTATVELANAGVVALSSYLGDTLAPMLAQLQEGMPGSTTEMLAHRRTLEQLAARTRLASRDLTDGASQSAEALRSRLGQTPLPATDRASVILVQRLDHTVQLLADIARQLRTLSNGPMANSPFAEQAAPAIPGVEQRRDQAGVVLDSLRKLKRPDLLRVTDVLERGSAALVVGPPGGGIAAIDMESLFPTAPVLDVGGMSATDVRRRAEELVTSSLAALLTPRQPIVMLVHAESTTLLDQPQLFQRLLQRMRLRGIDVVEWSVVLSETPPSLLAVDPEARNPARARPIVYVSIAPDSSAAAPRAGGVSGAQRAARLGEVLEQLVTRNENVLLCMNPSVLPGYGEPDPTVQVLAHFGLAADTGRPLVRELFSTRGRTVETALLTQALDGATPLNGAMHGLPTAVTWPITLVERPAPDRVRLTMVPLLSVDASSTLWTESQWLRIWQTPPEARSLIPPADQPVYDDGRDGRWPEGKESARGQQWLLAASVQRFEVGKKPQRAVIIGSNSWFIDSVSQAMMSVDGRAALRNPGNLELFESSVYWLADLDALIAQTPTAQATSMIGPMSESSLRRLQLGIIVGMPLSVLLLGAAYRFVRG
ncbi:MAG: hypothetical protein SFY69_02470 [Planctomycetota bacterium]|nr:hypothetical protein [Planctomycetota bacterium]